MRTLRLTQLVDESPIKNFQEKWNRPRKFYQVKFKEKIWVRTRSIQHGHHTLNKTFVFYFGTSRSHWNILTL